MLDHKQLAGDPAATSSEGEEDNTDGADAPIAAVGAEADAQSRDADAVPRSIAKDDAYHLLQNYRRRAVLRYLLAHPDRSQFRMRDLAEAIGAWEHETTRQQLNSTQRQRVYIGLYQSHLPKLDDHDVIEYNQPRGIVEPTPLIAALAPFLEDGLHADTLAVTIEDAPSAESTGDASRAGLVPVLSSLFSR